MTNVVEKDVVCSTGDVEGDVRWGDGCYRCCGTRCLCWTNLGGEEAHMCLMCVY
jgi:hypothetical protein